jgi:hypothetical protein
MGEGDYLLKEAWGEYPTRVKSAFWGLPFIGDSVLEGKISRFSDIIPELAEYDC